MHLGEVSGEGGRLVTGGVVGYVMVVTGTGPTVAAAKAAAYARIRNLVIPKMRYRTDIGDRFEAEDLAFFERVRSAYLELAQCEPSRITRIDAAQPRESVERQLEDALARFIEEFASR